MTRTYDIQVPAVHLALTPSPHHDADMSFTRSQGFLDIPDWSWQVVTIFNGISLGLQAAAFLGICWLHFYKDTDITLFRVRWCCNYACESHNARSHLLQSHRQALCCSSRCCFGLSAWAHQYESMQPPCSLTMIQDLACDSPLKPEVYHVCPPWSVGIGLYLQVAGMLLLTIAIMMGSVVRSMVRSLLCQPFLSLAASLIWCSRT